MSDELVLDRVAVEALRAGSYVYRTSSDGADVVVTTADGRAAAVSADGDFRVVLSLTDLDVASEPEGLVVADETRRRGWTVRVTS